MLFVGSLFNRRRLPDLIAAFALATRRAAGGAPGDRRRQPHLAAAGSRGGRRGARGQRADRASAATSPDAELAALYARASVFAFFSEYEGFGLTPLEAMAAGVPPVVLDTPVAREVYGDAAHLRRAGDIDGAAARASSGCSRTRPRQRRVLDARAGDPGALLVGRRGGTHAGAPRADRPADDAARSSSSASTRAPTSSAASRR